MNPYHDELGQFTEAANAASEFALKSGRAEDHDAAAHANEVAAAKRKAYKAANKGKHGPKLDDSITRSHEKSAARHRRISSLIRARPSHGGGA